jgi:membrane protease YdiL (CAAX protease family)
VLEAIGLVLCFLAVQVVASVVVAESTGSLDIDGKLGTSAAMSLSLIQAVGIAVGLIFVAAGVASRRGVGLRATPREVAAGSWALMPVGVLVIVPTIGASVASGDGLLYDGVGAARIAAFVLLAVLIAVNEELWFRGLVVDVLGGPRRRMLVLVVSSILFGLPHMGASAATALNSVGVTLAVGIPFAAVRLRHHALLPLIAWHAAIDAWAFLHTASVVAEGDPSIGDAATGLVLPLGLAIGYVLWLRRAPAPAIEA